MKKSSQGFVLIETLIVSTFIISILVYLFVQFSNIKKSYDNSYRYDAIPRLYNVNQIVDYLKENDTLAIATSLTNDGYIEIQDCNFVDANRTYCEKLMETLEVKTAIIIPTDVKSFKEKVKKEELFSEEMRNYILKLKIGTVQRRRVVVEFTDNTYGSQILKKGVES